MPRTSLSRRAPIIVCMSKSLYKVTFLNHGKVYELYAREVTGSHLWGFNQIGGWQGWVTK